MKIFETISSAINSVLGNKLRSLLTMLGIIIGIAAVIMIMSVGQGVENTIFGILESVDKRVIQVMLNDYDNPDDLLNYSDIEAISKLNGVDRVTVMNEYWGNNVQLMRPDEYLNGSVFGTDQNYGVFEKFEIQYGRFISENDVENETNVAVITPKTALQVFGYLNCVGETLEVETYNGTSSFTVIGVLEGEVSEEQEMLDMMMNTPLTRSVAIIPYTTMNNIFYNEDYIDGMAVSASRDYNTTEVSDSITRLLDLRHNTEDKYYAQSMEAGFEMMETVFSAVTGFITFVAGISLFVGGVGVMNIMLVSVRERTREIGIRKAIGATERNIQFQFLLESVVLTTLGGMIGVGIGLVLAHYTGIYLTGLIGLEVLPILRSNAFIISTGISTLVGIIFGVYPARKAAKLDPIVALRYE